MKYSGQPMTLGNAAAARIRLIVWCRECGRQVEPDPAEMAERYGAETTVPDWRERLVCSAAATGRWIWSSAEPSGDSLAGSLDVGRAPFIPGDHLPEILLEPWSIGHGLKRPGVRRSRSTMGSRWQRR